MTKWTPPTDLHAWAKGRLERIAEGIEQQLLAVESYNEEISQLLAMQSIRDQNEPSLLLAWVLTNDVKGEAINGDLKKAVAGRDFAGHTIEQLNKLRAIIELGLKS